MGVIVRRAGADERHQRATTMTMAVAMVRTPTTLRTDDTIAGAGEDRASWSGFAPLTLGRSRTPASRARTTIARSSGEESRPAGSARSMYTISASPIEVATNATTTIGKGTGPWRRPAFHRTPVSTIAGPIRLAGRRSHPSRPAI